MATADAAPGDSRTVEARCLCKALHFTLTLHTADLPLQTHLCHCSICRQTHGMLCVFHAAVPRKAAPAWVAPSGLHRLTGYRGADAPGTSIRYFCSTCGCHMGDYAPPDAGGDGGWVVATSLFAQDAGVFRLATHVYSRSAADGGLAAWLPRIGDREMRVWNPPDEQDGAAAPGNDGGGGDGGDNDDGRLLAQCHCGGVSFRIRRPTAAEAADPGLARFVSPVDPGKWMASLDACDDCRRVTGTHLVAWAFAPLAAVSASTSASSPPPLTKDSLRFGTMRLYESSPGVRRTFCGTCGATVFLSCDERPAVVDIAVGLLRAPEGPRAEAWLTWRAGRVAWVDSGLRYDAEFMRALSRGLHDWSMDKHGHALTAEL